MSASPRSLLALMGPSGAGKTSLLNVLRGRLGKGQLAETGGGVSWNGMALDYRTSRLLTSFVPQEDILLESLSPRETLMYARL